MKKELLQLKQDIIDISNDLKTNLADKGITADGTLSELVNKVPDIESNVLGEIGWNLSEQPFLKDAIEYAKEIQKNPKSTYKNDTRLVIFPKVDELEFRDSYFFSNSALTLFPENVKIKGQYFRYAFYNCYSLLSIDLRNLDDSIGSVEYAFYNCHNLQEIKLQEIFGKNIYSFQHAFYQCKQLQNFPTFDVSDATTVAYMFSGCSSLKSLTIIGDPSKITFTFQFLSGCTSLTYLSLPENFPSAGGSNSELDGIKVPKIYGSIDYSKNTTTASSYYQWLCGFTKNTYIRYMLVKNIGYYQNRSSIDMSYSEVWGIANDEVPDARQSLIDSLITYSYDRATAGYSTQTWKLHTNVKALLTDDEIAQITAKGYTLV